MLPILFFPMVAALIGWLANRVFSAILRASLISDRNHLVKTLTAEMAVMGQGAMPQEEAEEIIKGLRPKMEKHIGTFIEVKLPKRLPALAMFSGDKLMLDVKAAFLEEVDLLMPQLLQDARLHAGDFVKNRLEAMAPHDLALTFDRLTKKFFYRFQLFGAAMGFVIGIVFVIMVFVYYYLFLSK